MNIIKNLQARINERLAETSKPCKTYASYNKADEVGEKFAAKLGKAFDTAGRPARYVVVYIDAMQRYTPAFDYSELFSRSTAMGGYVGMAANAGFYSF